MIMARRSWAAWAVIVGLAASSLSSCGPLPKAEYWQGSFLHLHPPRYTFEVPEGWREAKASDYPSVGFNRKIFEALDEEKRSAFLRRAELEIQVLDTGLISSRGAWIQVASAAGSGGWNTFPESLRYGLSEGQTQALWERFATGRIQRAPSTDKPTLTLESMDVVPYGFHQVLRVRFRSDEARGSMHWTVLGLYTENDTVSIAHLGIPEDRDEGIAGLEAIVTSLRFD